MKKIIFASFILLASLAHSQTYTTVTATVQDTTGQVWSNLSVTAIFIPPPNGTGQPNNGGLPITDTPQYTVGDVSGTFTITVDDNTAVRPAGSRWSFQICSNTSDKCSNLMIGVSGPTMNITSQINAAITAPVVNGGVNIPRVYNTVTEASGGNGSVFWRTSDNTLWGCQTVPSSICPPGFVQIGALPVNVLKWQGNWSALVNYNIQDIVFYNFTAWIALVANTASTPTVSNVNWQALTTFGANKQVLYNDNGVLTGDGNFTFDKITSNLTIGGVLTSQGLTSNGTGAWSVSASEGTNNCTPAPSVDCLWADSISHRWLMNNNNAGNLRLVGITTPGTSGHLAVLSANGIDVQDGGAPNTNLGTVTTTGSPTTSFLAAFSGPTSITNGPSIASVSNAITGDYVQASTVSGCGATCTFTYAHTYSVIHSCVCSGEGGSCNVVSKTTSVCTINTTVGTNDIIVSGVY